MRSSINKPSTQVRRSQVIKDLSLDIVPPGAVFSLEARPPRHEGFAFWVCNHCHEHPVMYNTILLSIILSLYFLLIFSIFYFPNEKNYALIYENVPLSRIKLTRKLNKT